MCVSKEAEFTSRVVEAIEKGKVDELLDQMNSFLATLTSTRPKLNRIDQLKVKNLIMDIIHQISVLEELLQSKTTNKNNWNWFK